MKTHRQYIEEQTQADPAFADDIAEADALTAAHARIAELTAALQQLLVYSVHTMVDSRGVCVCRLCAEAVRLVGAPPYTLTTTTGAMRAVPAVSPPPPAQEPIDR